MLQGQKQKVHGRDRRVQRLEGKCLDWCNLEDRTCEPLNHPTISLKGQWVKGLAL